MGLQIYCSTCDNFTDIDKHSVYKEYGDITVECSHCGEQEDAD